ncbi:MAG: iron ABC transporter permease [Candidatus Krumholzibacteriota bacterium]|nr:iron ABC transporter permease [Candidatus Krumholzibacteriota bacterium]
MKNKRKLFIAFFFLASFTVIAAAPFFGVEKITPGTVLRPDSDDVKAEIFWKIRVPRVIAAFCAGAALALSGMAFQAIFRNPLATPFTLGVSSGSAFGAAIYIQMGISFSLPGISGQSLFAFMAALVSIGIVYGLTRLKKGFSTATMLISGVAVNFFFSSLILFIQYISDFDNSFRIIRWLMGGFEIVGYSPVLTILPFIAIGTIMILLKINELNLITAGDDLAAGKGVDIKRTRTVIFLAASLMIGSIVSIFGVIGFVGMMVPHICRLIAGYNHRNLAPASLVFGGTFLVICDTLSRTVIAPAEIPVGVITALLGGPFFIYLLLSGFSVEGRR